MTAVRNNRWMWLLAWAGAAVFLSACGDDVGGAEAGTEGGASGGGGTIDGAIGDDDAGGTGTDTAGTSSGGEDGASSGASSGGASSGGDAEGDGASSGGASSGGDGVASSGGPDTAGLDCPGGPGCPCEKNDECDTSYCLDFPEGKKCAQLCTETCPQGLVCKDISGGQGDKVFACIPPFIALCAPCTDDQICQQNGVKGACVDYGPAGRFCGGPCEKDDECPVDYQCIEAEAVDGSKSKQCKRKPDAANPVCGCSEWALNKGAKTMCGKTNTFGTCQAERKCTANGLEACAAADAKAEECNAADDDCNGKVDDLDAEYKCSKKLFAELGSMATCTNDGDCAGKGKDGAVEKCDIPDGKSGGLCKQLEGECFGIPSCTAGGKLICNEAKTPVPEACDLQDNDCDGETDDKGVVCNDNNECTSDECDGNSGECSNPPSVDCDDNNPCTADSCDKKAGKCINTLTKDASCDDGNACSVGDVCGEAKDGSAACLPGATTKVCDDANLCTDDSCDPKTGCVGLPNAATQACYSGEPKTEGVGTCTGGIKYCKEGALQGACVGQVTPNNNEICDAKDDDCNGVTDNGCSANLVHVRTSTVAGTINGEKYVASVRGGSETVVQGNATGAKSIADFGWYAWLKQFASK